MNAPNSLHNFDSVAPQVHEYVTSVWPGQNSNIKVIGEPGRQISEEALTLIVQVFLIKKQGEFRHLYINNGVYQGFGCKVFDKQTILGQPLLPAEEL